VGEVLRERGVELGQELLPRQDFDTVYDAESGSSRRMSVDFPVCRGPSSRTDFGDRAMARVSKREKTMRLNYAVF